MLFTQFHTAPSCTPTRAMLMSGNNNHVAGIARQNADGLLGSPVAGYENSPHAAGFSRSYNLLQGEGTHFDAVCFKEGGSAYAR
jgi:arylsulfatase A-like enzyme